MTCRERYIPVIFSNATKSEQYVCKNRKTMKILVTGAKGFVGKNLCWALKNIQAGKDKSHPGLNVEAVYE